MPLPNVDTWPGRAADRAALETPGYFVCPLLDEATVGYLLSRYWAMVPPGEQGLQVDYMRSDRAAYRRLAQMGDDAVRAPLTERLGPFDPTLTTFVTKHPDPDSEMFLHDDRTVLDDGALALTVWVPLVDTSAALDNGPLAVVENSHRVGRGPSGSLTPQWMPVYESALRQRLVTLDVPAGHAVIYDGRLVHCSAANRSADARVALIAAVVPPGSQPIHVVATSATRRRVLAVDRDFFFDHHVRDVEAAIPAGYPTLREFDESQHLDPADLAEVLAATELVAEGAPPDDTADGFGGAPLAVPGAPPGAMWAEIRGIGTAAAWRDGALVLELAPGASARLELDADATLRCESAAQFGLVVWSGGRPAYPVIGSSAVVGGGVTLWNDGPGSAVVSLRR